MRTIATACMMVLVGCGGSNAAVTTPAPVQEASPPALGSLGASSASSVESRRDCIVIQDENPVPAKVVGVLTKSMAKSGTDTPFVLRLTTPRCVIGLARAAFVQEVHVATAGPDLRPLVDQKLTITGNAIGGQSDMGGPAVIILAKDIEREFGGMGSAP